MGPSNRELERDSTPGARPDQSEAKPSDAVVPTARGRILPIPALTSLRFLAAAYVVLFHASPTIGPLLPLPVARLIGGGYLAVPLFYVLSGFVLMLNYGTPSVAGRVRSRAFLIARFARVYPLYLLAALWQAANLGLSAQVPWADLALPTLREVLMLQAWHLPWTRCTNGPGWSVSAEAFFYLLFPWLSLPVGRLAKKFAIYALGGVWLAGVAAIMLASRAGVADHDLIYLPLAHLPAFIMGMLLARVFELRAQPSDPSRAALAGWLVTASVIGLGLLLQCQLPFALTATSLFLPLAAAMIWGLARRSRGAGGAGWWENPTLVWFGEASYALYILQAPVADLLRFFPAHRLNGTWVRYPPYWAILWVSALLSYQFLERPARSQLRRFIQAR